MDQRAIAWFFVQKPPHARAKRCRVLNDADVVSGSFSSSCSVFSHRRPTLTTRFPPRMFFSFPSKRQQGMYEYASELGLIQEGMMMQDAGEIDLCLASIFDS